MVAGRIGVPLGLRMQHMAELAQLTVIEFTKQQFLFYFYARRVVFRLWPIKPQRGLVPLLLLSLTVGPLVVGLGRHRWEAGIRLVTGDIICQEWASDLWYWG